MRLWTAIKRINQRSDNWSRQAVERMIANVDRPDRSSIKRHISIRDLFATGLNAIRKS
jgi:hypothetical protein